MNVLIIGGTRFLGPFVVKELVELGHNVAVFNRGLSKTELPTSVRWITGDRGSLEECANDFNIFKPDVVLDMIPYNEDEAKRVVEVFQEMAGRIVAISSADVYQSYGRLIGFEEGEPVPTPSTEDSPLREKFYPYRSQVKEDHPFFQYDKILVERTFLKDSKIPGTILRLPMVYGKGDRQHRLFQYLKRINDGRPMILLDEHQANWKTCRGYVENVAHAIVLAVINPISANKIYNVADINCTELEWVECIKKSTHWKGDVQIIPSGVLPLDFNPLQHLDLSSDKIRTELGYTEKISFEEGLRRTIEWENENDPDPIPEMNYDEEDAIIEKYITVS